MATHVTITVQLDCVECGPLSVRRQSMMGAALHDRAAFVATAGKLAGEAWDETTCRGEAVDGERHVRVQWSE